MLSGRGWWLNVAAALLLGCGGGGGGSTKPTDGGSPPGPGDAAPSLPTYQLPGRITVEPAALLFTKPGEQAQLRAQVFDADGKPVMRAVTWESSQAAVTVDGDGRVSSVAPLGSALVRAHAGEIISEPVLVLIAEPPAGAVLVSDAQIVGEPVVTTKGLAPEETQRRVQLTGVEAPMVGAIVLAREGKAVAGRVVSATPMGGGFEVVLQGVPLLDMFRRLDVKATYRIDERAVALAALFPPPAPAPAPARRRPGDDGAQGPQPREVRRNDAPFKLGPFECEIMGNAQLITGAIGPRIVPGLNFDLVLNKDADGWKEVTVKAEGTLTTVLSGALTMAPGFAGSLTCKATLTRVSIYIGGPLATVIGLRVPLGGKFGVEAMATLSPLEVKPELKGTSKTTIGFTYTPQAGAVNLSNVENTFEPKCDLSGFPDEDLPFRIEGTLSAGLFAGLELGSPFGEALGLVKPLEIVDAFLGLKLEFKLAPESTQLSDPAFASSYELKLASEVGPGSSVQDALKWFGGTVSLKSTLAAVEKPIGRSPFGTITADKTSVPPGDMLTLKVALDAKALQLAGIDNVKRVRFLQATPEKPEPMEVDSIDAKPGQTEFKHMWTPTPLDKGTHRFYASVTSVLAPGIALEVTENSEKQIRVGPGGWKGSVQISWSGQKTTPFMSTSPSVTSSGTKTLMDTFSASLEVETDDQGRLRYKSGSVSAMMSYVVMASSSGTTLSGCMFSETMSDSEVLMGEGTAMSDALAGSVSTYDGMYDLSVRTPPFQAMGTKTSSVMVMSTQSCGSGNTSNTQPIMEQGLTAQIAGKGTYEPATAMIKGSSTEMGGGWRGTPVTITKSWNLSQH